MEDKSRLLYLDLAKGIAIILIVWAHVDCRMNAVFYRQCLQFVHGVIYSFHIPLFFMISGILTRMTHDKTGFRFDSYIKKLTTRTLIPFYFLSVLFLVINVIVPRSFTHAPNFKEMVMALLYMQSHPQYLPSGVLWFLFTLFIFSLITTLIIKVLRMNPYVWLLLSVILFFMSPFFWDNYIFAIDRISRNLMFYVFGYLFVSYIHGDVLSKNNSMLISLGVIWISAFIFFYKGLFLLRIVTGITGSLCVLTIMQHAQMKAFLRLCDLLYYVGRNSMEIFVLHMPVALLIFKALGMANLLVSCVGFFIALVACILIPLVMGGIIGFIPHVYKLMFGRLPMHVGLAN
jgi:fucose 4-O-acetylase-like acetyltransferase